MKPTPPTVEENRPDKHGVSGRWSTMNHKLPVNRDSEMNLGRGLSSKSESLLGSCKYFLGTPHHGNNNPSTLVLTLVAINISKVTATRDPTKTNNEQLWPSSVELYPEYLITVMPGLSITLSLSTFPR